MFEGKAEEAMKYYVSLFDDASITSISRYTKEGPGKEGTVMQARMRLAGQDFMCIDSSGHAFTFTPAISLFVDCVSAEEQERLFSALSADGKVMMPMDNYGFSKRFAWVEDRFGVSWQLNLV